MLKEEAKKKEIELVVKEYEEKQRKKKEKRKAKDGAKDKDEEKKDKKAEIDDDAKAEKEKDEKVFPCTPPSSYKVRVLISLKIKSIESAAKVPETAELPRIYALHRYLLQPRSFGLGGTADCFPETFTKCAWTV